MMMGIHGFVLVAITAIVAVRAGFPAFGNGNFGSFPSMQPMTFPAFQMQSQRQASNLQTQGATQGQSAATGSGTADEGQLSSVQTSNTNTSHDGTVSQGGSLGQCQGTACALNGASQVGNQGQFQSQSNSLGQKTFGSQGQTRGAGSGAPAFPTFGNLFGSQNNALQSQFQSQFNSGGASVGNAAVDKGTVNSAQNTQAQTGKEGSQVLSTSIGQGQGTNAALSGAVQATGQGQTAGQINGLSSSDQSQKLTGVVGDGSGAAGALTKNGAIAGQQSQSQLQTQGTGAATGNANADEGTVQNLLSSNVNTNALGTSVSSNAANSASGKGLKVGGAVSAGGQGQSQENNQLALNLLNGSGMMLRPLGRDRSYAPISNVVVPQPVPVGGSY